MRVLAGLGRSAAARWRDPVAWTEAIQIGKTVAAAVTAWVLAADVLGLPQPFLAPWAALLVVHATVHRSLWTGVRQVAATVVGVVLAWVTGAFLGLDWFSLSVMLLAALVIGRLRWLKEEATTAAATALIVLTTGYSDDGPVLVGRLLDTAIGVGVGVVVNALVWPPLRDLTAARAVEAVGREVGELLGMIAEEFRDGCTEEHVEDWVSRSQDLDVQVDEAWGLVRQARESGRLNPRKDSAVVREPGSFGEILDRTEQALAEIRSMARTLEHSVSSSNRWDDEFRERWTRLLEEVAAAVRDSDGARLTALRGRLARLASDYSDENLPARHWPEYGGLLLNLRNVATAMGDVAGADPVSESSRGRLRVPAL